MWPLTKNPISVSVKHFLYFKKCRLKTKLWMKKHGWFVTFFVLPSVRFWGGGWLNMSLQKISIKMRVQSNVVWAQLPHLHQQYSLLYIILVRLRNCTSYSQDDRRVKTIPKRQTRESKSIKYLFSYILYQLKFENLNFTTIINKNNLVSFRNLSEIEP